MLALALVVAWASSALGVVDVLERDLRRVFYAVRGPRPATARVILVALDDATVDAWGAPPWTWAQLEELLERIEAGGPRVLAVLEPGARLATGPRPPSLTERVERAGGRWILPPERVGLGQPGLVLDARGTVEAIDLGRADMLAGLGVTARVIATAGLGAREGRLDVNFLGPGGTFPTLAAHRVAAGELPPETFAGRIVVIGVRGDGFAPAVPTAVGPLAPAEVHAHAVHALAEAAGLARPAAWWAWLLAVMFGLAALVLLPRAGSALAWAGGVVVPGGAALVLAYLAFAHLGLLVPVVVPLATAALCGAGALLLERGRAQEELARLARWSAQRLSLEERGTDTDDEALGRRFLHASRTFVDHAGSALLPLAPGRWHVELGPMDGLAAVDVVERRRDVRRDPWRLAYSSQRPAWANRPVLAPERAERTLVVPIVAFTKLLGFWILGVPAGATLGPDALRLVEGLAGQLAITLERRRIERLSARRAPGGGRLGSRLAREIDEARQNALAVAEAQHELARLVEAMPVGVLTASMWGELEQVNDAMRRLLTACGAEPDRKLGLEPLLTAVVRRPPEVVRELLRRLVIEGGVVRLSTRPTPAAGPHAAVDLILARLAGGEDGAGPRFVLTATTRDERPLAALPWDLASEPDGGGPRLVAVDVGRLVRETVDELQRDRSLRSTRALIVEVPSARSEVLVPDADLRAAVRELLAEALRHGPADVPGRVSIEDHDDVVIVRIVDPAVSLPAGDVARVRAGDLAGGDDDPVHRLARAKARVEAAHGELELESDLDRGTTIVVRLPKPGR